MQNAELGARLDGAHMDPNGQNRFQAMLSLGVGVTMLAVGVWGLLFLLEPILSPHLGANANGQIVQVSPFHGKSKPNEYLTTGVSNTIIGSFEKPLGRN